MICDPCMPWLCAISLHVHYRGIFISLSIFVLKCFFRNRGYTLWDTTHNITTFQRRRSFSIFLKLLSNLQCPRYGALQLAYQGTVLQAFACVFHDAFRIRSPVYVQTWQRRIWINGKSKFNVPSSSVLMWTSCWSMTKMLNSRWMLHPPLTIVDILSAFKPQIARARQSQLCVCIWTKAARVTFIAQSAGHIARNVILMLTS